MNSKKSEEMITEIAKIYFISIRQIQEIEEHTISNGSRNIDSPFYKYFNDVEEAFSKLSVEYQRIINNEFFFNAYRNWWTSSYTLSEFKKRKKLAVREFLEVFYEIH